VQRIQPRDPFPHKKKITAGFGHPMAIHHRDYDAGDHEEQINRELEPSRRPVQIKQIMIGNDGDTGENSEPL
jgi:hypothetical protein